MKIMKLFFLSYCLFLVAVFVNEYVCSCECVFIAALKSYSLNAAAYDTMLNENILFYTLVADFKIQ